MSGLDRPILDSDFDGVALAPLNTHESGMFSFPLPLQEGYEDLLNGFIDAGGELGEINTSRSAIVAPFTYVSFYKNGLSRYFGRINGVHHSHSERNKSNRLIKRASNDIPLAFIDKDVQTVGHILTRDIGPLPNGIQITLGAPYTENRKYLFDVLKIYINSIPGAEVDSTNDSGGFAIENGQSRIDVVALEPFSYAVGERFAVQAAMNYIDHTHNLDR